MEKLYILIVVFGVTSAVVFLLLRRGRKLSTTEKLKQSMLVKLNK
jgi:hypothetical protein